MHLQEIANKLPDAFNDAGNVIKSHMLAMNAPDRINVLVGQSQNAVVREFAIRQKRSRPIGSNNSTSQKRRNEQLSHVLPKRHVTLFKRFLPERHITLLKRLW